VFGPEGVNQTAPFAWGWNWTAKKKDSLRVLGAGAVWFYNWYLRVDKKIFNYGGGFVGRSAKEGGGRCPNKKSWEYFSLNSSKIQGVG